MGNLLVGFVLPMLLLAAALMNWSLICLVDLILFLVFQFNASKLGFLYNKQSLLLLSTIIYSVAVTLSQSIFLILWTINGENWNVTDLWWIKLLGFMTVDSWRSPSVVYFLVLQLLAGLVAIIELNWNGFGLVRWQDSFWSSFLSIVEHIGTRMRNACCLLLPAVQLVVGISQPSWISLPFFIGSCVGLVDWSLTSNFLGLFRWWRALQLYAGFCIFLLYVYQLPMEFLDISRWVADFIGLYQISSSSEWTKICCSISLLLFFVMISRVKCNLEEMDFILSSSESHLTEQLLPSKYSFFIRESRSGVRHSNMLLRRSIFRAFSINFFTYGFPVSLLALAFWSFHFASICAFGLLAYVGYIMYVFPSLFRLHRLNGLLLVFILLWAGGTYVFNVAFSSLKGKLGKDMEVWEMVGLWHYPIPGFFLLAQFSLGVLVALGNLVSNSVFLCLSDEYGQSTEDNSSREVEKDTKVLVVATVAWGLRKCSRAIILALIFLISMKPGFIRAVYMIFFMIYLLSHDIGRRTRQCLILLCEIHFTLLYILRIDMILKAIEKTGSSSAEILSQLGLLHYDGWDFFEIAFLACFCAIHNHGFNMLFSFSAVVQQSPCPPIGFGILNAGLNKSVLLSVYASRNSRSQERTSSERRIASFLSAIGQKFLSMYRSCGTPIAFLTILLTLYLMKPNYVSFGYIFLLLIWIVGRQLVEKSKRRLWFPLKAYAVGVFIFIYSLSTFSSFQMWLSGLFDLYFYLGYNVETSFLENVGESLAVMVVMQLYSYERRQSKYIRLDDTTYSESGLLGFIKRLLIWHSNKILYIAVFYASLSPVSLFGFLYLVGLVACSTLRKASKFPSKLFLVYTGVLVITEYLFQMWGMQAGIFPGKKYFDISVLLGLQLFKPGFWGLEQGLRGKVLVISACILQYNVFHWMEKLPTYISRKEKWEEPCPLFISSEDAGGDFHVPNGESERSENSDAVAGNLGIGVNPSPSSASGNIQNSNNKTEGSMGSSSRKYSFSYIWGRTQESNKWDKRRMRSLRNERFETQKSIVKVYLKFWVENMFNLFGLEINMIALLLSSFALLNAISILYIALLAACILLSRRVIRKLWPLFVFLFASVLIVEYFAVWKNTISPNQAAPDDAEFHCHECSKNSKSYLHYCEMCWLGIFIDDSRVLINYFTVFILACFKLRADRLSSFSGSYTYRQVMSQQKNIFVWRDLSFETKSMWTILDYLRLCCFCHLLDLVLALILITGTLEYDILHLGYLGFALVFFRMRLEILKKRNKIFKFLRMYNFAVIVLSLAYQSPFIGDFSLSRSTTLKYIFEVIGFHKYDYGFQITARSALVEIIIFILISLQSYMFSSPEFDYVSRYLEAEQIGALVREQEKKAAWKTSELQHIRESEDKKRQRNMQVEKMKSEMLNVQVQLDNGHSAANCANIVSESQGFVQSAMVAPDRSSCTSEREEQNSRSQNNVQTEPSAAFESYNSPVSINSENPFTAESIQRSLEHSSCEITEIEEHPTNYLIDELNKKDKGQAENPLISAVQLIGDGVFQVQSIGNQAVNNLVSFLNIKPDESDLNERVSFEDGKYDQMEVQKRHFSLNRSSSVQSDNSSAAASLQLGRIFHHIWSQMQANIDVVCYCCFVLVYLWNFSLLSMVYLAALFLYALCVNTGPGYIFWVTMLIYTEIYILLQYLYQIIIQHHGWSATSSLIFELGFPEHRITSSFVIGAIPLFLVYLFTLIQSSITAKDGEWMSTSELNYSGRGIRFRKEIVRHSWTQRAHELQHRSVNRLKRTVRGFIWFWKSMIKGAESPPYFVQVSMDVSMWPDGGIQPERIESAMNQLLQIMHNQECTDRTANHCPYASKVHVQSIERSSENPNIAVVVFEVIYASPLSGCGSAEWYKSLTPAIDVAKEILSAQESGVAGKIRFPYNILSVIGGGKREVDLYAYIFGADLTVFFLVTIFYQSVMKNKSELLDVSQLEDQFPKDFVFMLMGIFFLIVVDRIIYLCSFAIGKVIFYVFNLILFTYYITMYSWRPSQQATGVLALRFIYLAKAVSLALQAIQIRYGIPHQSTLYRQFLTSEVSRINYLGYRLYRALPFLYELRCVLDWSCTTTSLTMYDWLKLEDINASLYLVKCDTVLNRAGHKSGEKQSTTTKCCNGICLFFVLICVIWAPMLMYSSGNPTNIANPIKDASVQIDIRTAAGKLTLYETTLCEKLQWGSLNNEVNLDPEHYLDTFDKIDVQLVCCQADASSLWLVPEVVKSRFIQSLEWGTDMDLSYTWILSRERPKGKEVVRYVRPVDAEDLPAQLDVKMVFNGSSNSFRIDNVCPRYLRVTSSGEVRPLELEVNTVSADLVMNHAEFQWWSFHDVNTSLANGCGGLTGPMAIIVSEETPPQGILGDTLSKFSIWGLYITFVLAVGRFIRLQCSDLRMRIPYENLPTCDRLIAMCENIYSARAEGELGVEEVLYWTLVKIYRSPHMLLEYTKAD